ncbi:hemin-degrading factor [Tropicibacter sp. R15_0]|uniref:hemin-degrading factor n=1 Tax=Tropicibacter sp. R15_0 TaxID=2821101 RepID=UPI001ADBDEC1|nr:ChuX/HutX family heme-like substrate-binding protein [Tropicibacter sp. R15_0]MBO9467826.1 hemin-degrading factor [Tropicibacter sp. R15_0]
MADLTPDELRNALATSKKRARDLADELGVAEAQLLAAQVGHGVTRIEANPNRLIPEVEALGEVMALTRNDSCVIEKVGRYAGYRPGDHASMIFSETIDLRFFPSQWQHAFAVEQESDSGVKRSVQIFDAAGDAVHKIHLRPDSNHPAWPGCVGGLDLRVDSQSLNLEPRKPVEPAKSNPDKRDILLSEWEKLTDTHQFLRLCAKLKMNRLGAYRIAEAPWVRRLDVSAVNQMLEQVQESGIEFMFFVGNQGCIEIHSGPIGRLKEMGPWQNILDPGFDMHLRMDHVAEVWAVEKPTRRGPAISVEAFDARGYLIFQAFGVGFEGRDSRPAWNAIVKDLPSLEVVPA